MHSFLHQNFSALKNQQKDLSKLQETRSLINKFRRKTVYDVYQVIGFRINFRPGFKFNLTRGQFN